MERVMNDRSPTAKPTLPALDPADAIEIGKLDALIEQGRRASSPAARVAGREVRILMWLNGLMVIPIISSYVWLPRPQAAYVSLYIAIVAIVISGFGIYRSMFGLHANRPRPWGIGGLGIILFAIMFSFYGVIILTLTHPVDSDVESLQYGKWGNSPMRKK
jgi:hypothetical protein